MKELIKKQEEEFDELFDIGVIIGAEDLPYQQACMNNNGVCDFVRNKDIKNFIQKVRKEIARAIYDEIILELSRGKRINVYNPMIKGCIETNEHNNRLTQIIAKVIEAKKQILREL